VSNGSFDNGFTSWNKQGAPRLGTTSTEAPRTAPYDAWLGGYAKHETDGVSQSVTIPSGCSSYQLTFWLHVDTNETTTQAADTMTVKVGNTTVATYSNRNAAGGYSQVTLNLAQYAGRTVTLSFTANETGTRQTSFVVDDVAVNVS
jgi:aminopeptidase S